MLSRFLCLSFVLLLIGSSAANAATLASNGFEGVGGELPFTSTVTPSDRGQIITATAANPVFMDTQSLRFDKLGSEASSQTDFDIVFDTVDVSQFVDVALEFHWHANPFSNNYETADSLTFTIAHDGTGGPIVISVTGAELEDARNGSSTDEWQDILASIPDNATMLDFSVNARINAAAEDIFFDELVITGTQVAVPEPASIAVWTLLGLVGVGFAMRRRRSRD